jgi:hypothetical protein
MGSGAIKTTCGLPVPFTKSMRSTELKDPVAKAAALLRRDKQRGQLRRSEWDFEGEDLLLFNGCIYVPDATDLQ